jgi:hypothetical protein
MGFPITPNNLVVPLIILFSKAAPGFEPRVEM